MELERKEKAEFDRNEMAADNKDDDGDYGDGGKVRKRKRKEEEENEESESQMFHSKQVYQIYL